MKIFKEKLKRSVAMLIALVLCFNSFGAIVSDNDGSAFVTKGEFEAMKKSFADQIVNYNNSIDGKIDGAIAAYLAGLVTTTITPRSIIYPDAVKYGVISISTASVLDYQFGIPMCTYEHMEGRFITNTKRQVAGTLYKSTSRPGKAELYRQEKTVITDLYANDTNTDKSIAKWDGYYDKCYDEVDFAQILIDTENDGAQTMSFTGSDQMAIQNTYCITNKDLTKLDLQDGSRCFNTRWGRFSGTSRSGINSSAVLGYIISTINQEWGTVKYPYVSVLNDYKYDMFSNKERNYNWSYPGDYKNVFKDHNGRSFANGTDEVKGNGRKWTGHLVETNVAYHYYYLFASGAIPCYNDAFNQSVNPYRIVNQGPNDAKFASGRCWVGSGNQYLYIPTLGFETTYLKRWSQIYYDASANIAKTYKSRGYDTSSSILTNDKDPTNITYHLGLTSGFPLIQIDKNTSLRYNLKFEDATKDYVVWVSAVPFSSELHPDKDPDCLELTGLDKADVGEKGYLVKKGKGTFTTDVIDKESTIFIKWGIYNKDLYKIGGGKLMPEEDGYIIKGN